MGDPGTVAWQRFGREVKRTRVEELDLPYRAAACRADVAEATWMRAERGERLEPRVVNKIGAALGWAPGYAESIIYEARNEAERLERLEDRLARLEESIRRLAHHLSRPVDA